MNVAVVLNRVDFGGVSVANFIICEQLAERGFDVQLVLVSPEAANGDFLLKEREISVIRPCMGVKSKRKRCRILLDLLSGFDTVIFAESRECQYVISALPDHVLVIKAVHNTVECLSNRFHWNQRSINSFVCVSPVVREMTLLRNIRTDIKIIPDCTDFQLDTECEDLSDVPVIGYVGRFHEAHKGISVLPQIANELKERDISAQWLLAGDGPERESLIRAFNKAGIELEIEKLDQDGVRSFLMETDLLVIPSNFEAFGIVLAEGMATGSVPVCSNAPVFSWILGNHSENLQVMNNLPSEYADIIQRLLENPDEYSFHRDLLKKRQKKLFSAKAVGQGYESLIRELKNSKRKVPRTGCIHIPLGERCQDFWWGRVLHHIYMKFK